MIELYEDETLDMLREEMGVNITETSVTIPRDFCFCSLLNFLGPRPNQESYDFNIEVMSDLEAFFGTCGGEKPEYVKERIKSV